jgi:hypothetical protein
MSPSSSPVRRRRPRRPSRGRNRPPRRRAISTVVRSVLVLTAVSSIAIGTYFAFMQNTILELPAQIDHQYFDQKQIEQQVAELLRREETLEQLLTSDLSATGTIKPERSTPTEPTPPSPINNTVVAPPDHEARQSPELPASATKKHRQIHHAAHQRALLRHRVAPPAATPAEQSFQLTSAITKPNVVPRARRSYSKRAAASAGAGGAQAAASVGR